MDLHTRLLPATLRFGAIAIGALALSACGTSIEVSIGGEDGEGTVETRVIEVDAFDKIDLDSFLSAVVVVDPSSEPTLSLTTNPNLFDNFSADVDDGTLAVSMSDVGNADENLVTITVPSLDSFSANGATSAEISGVMASFDLEMRGASDVIVVGADGVEIPELTVTADGASSADLSDLPVVSASVDIDGSSSVDINVSDVVTGSVAGASSLDVEGDGRVEATTSGAASIDR